MNERPLEISLRDLSRSPGSMRDYELMWEVPEDLGTSIMRVAPGSELPIDVAITSVDDGVLVRVHADVDLEGECVRCLDEVHRHHSVDIDELLEDRPLCKPDCQGLCPGCGEKWEDLPEDHEHVVIDPRLAGLAGLFDQLSHRDEN